MGQLENAVDKNIGARLRPPSLLVVLLTIGTTMGAYLFLTGVTYTPDSNTYDIIAGRLVDTGFDLASVYAEAQSRFPPLLYAEFVLLAGVLKALFGANWGPALVALNFAAVLTLGVMLVRLVSRVTESAATAWLALLLFAGCFNIAQWVPTVLSDATFVLLAFAIFSMAAKRILEPGLSWWPVLALAIIGVFYRPTGFVLLPDLALAAFLAQRQQPLVKPQLLFLLLTAIIITGVLVFAWLMQDPNRWPFETLSSVFRYVSADYALGEVVSARLDTYHLPPQSVLDFALISADRFVHFFAPINGVFSLGHIIAELAFYIPCYLLAGWLLFRLARRNTAYGPRVQKLFLVSAGAVFAYALFHSLIQVDFDWRYRVPIIPHLILLAAGGLADLERRLRRSI